MTDFTPDPGNGSFTFEQAITRLEEIVSLLEDENISLESALSAYEEGIKLASYCRDRLNTVEMRVQKITLD